MNIFTQIWCFLSREALLIQIMVAQQKKAIEINLMVLLQSVDFEIFKKEQRKKKRKEKLDFREESIKQSQSRIEKKKFNEHKF